MKNFTQRIGWTLVLGCCLGVSAWSLFYVARKEGAPVLIAAVVSTCFDGVALLCADYSLRYVRSGDSGIIPRLAVYCFAGASAYINSMHAVIAHQGNFARVLWAVPSIAAVVVFEIHARHEKRLALARLNKTLPPLPALGILAWFLFPIESFRTVRRLIAYQRRQMLARYAPGAFTRDSGPEADSLPDPAESNGTIGGSFAPEIETSQVVSIVPMAVIRAWALGRGYPVNSRGSVPADIIARYYRETSEGGNENEQSG